MARRKGFQQRRPGRRVRKTLTQHNREQRLRRSVNVISTDIVGWFADALPSIPEGWICVLMDKIARGYKQSGGTWSFVLRAHEHPGTRWIEAQIIGKYDPPDDDELVRIYRLFYSKLDPESPPDWHHLPTDPKARAFWIRIL